MWTSWSSTTTRGRISTTLVYTKGTHIPGIIMGWLRKQVGPLAAAARTEGGQVGPLAAGNSP